VALRGEQRVVTRGDRGIGHHQLAVGQRDPADVAQARHRLLHADALLGDVDAPVAGEAAQRREGALEAGTLGLEQFPDADAGHLALGRRVLEREEQLHQVVEPVPAGVREQGVVGTGRDLLVEQHHDGAAELLPDSRPLLLLLHRRVLRPRVAGRTGDRDELPHAAYRRVGGAPSAS